MSTRPDSLRGLPNQGGGCSQFLASHLGSGHASTGESSGTLCSGPMAAAARDCGASGWRNEPPRFGPGPGPGGFVALSCHGESENQTLASDLKSLLVRLVSAILNCFFCFLLLGLSVRSHGEIATPTTISLR